MQIITGEFVILCILVFLGAKLKRHLPSPESLLRGLTVYLPPTPEVLAKARESPDKFTINIGRIDDTFSRSSKYFPSAEISLSIGVLTLAVSLLSQALQYIQGSAGGDTISFYMSFLMIYLCVSGLYSVVFAAGIRNPDNVLGFFLSLTTFCFSSLLIYMDHQSILDFNFHFSAKLLGLKVTAVIQHIWPVSLEISILNFSLLFSLCLAACSFPFFRYTFRYIMNYYSALKSPIKDESTALGNWKFPFTIVSPLILMILYVKPMLKSPLVPGILSESTFEYLRLLIIVSIVLLRLSNIRNEVQMFLNQNKNLIFGMMTQKGDEDIENSQLQCKAIASYAWPLAYQSLCWTGLLVYISLLLYTKSALSEPYPVPVHEEAQVHTVPEYLDEDEFYIGDTAQYPIVTPSRTVIYYKEIQALERYISQVKSEKSSESPFQSILALSKEQLIPPVFYRDCFHFTIWWYGVWWCLVTVLSLLYSRRFSK